MSLDTVCRLCLAINSPIHALLDSTLQVIYEKLTNISLNAPRRPLGACLLCYSQLRKCHNLMVRSVRADKVLSQILRRGEVVSVESIAAINRKAYRLNSPLTLTPIEHWHVTFASSGHDLEEDEPPQSHCKEIETDAPISLVDIKCEELEEEWIDRAGVENEEDGESVALIDVHNVKSEIKKEVDTDNERWTIDKTVLEDDGEFIDEDNWDDLDGLKDIKIECMVPSVLEGIEDMDIRKEFDGAVPTMKWRQTYTKTQDETVTQNIPEYQWKRTPYMLRSSKEAAELLQKSPQISMNTLTYPSTVINKGNIADNDIKCTETDAAIDDTGSEDLKEMFICYNCGDIFNDKCLLREHIDYHRGERRSKKCTKVENQRVTETSLLKKHTKERPESGHLEYDICERRFIKRNNSDYFKTHTGEKPFTCSVCQRNFTNKSGLKIHFMTHTGEKPYECDKCPRRFIQKSHLDYHSQSHTGEKLFKCSMCPRSFTQAGNLKTHLRTHTRETPFQCAICQRNFIQKIHLDNHLRMHTGERPFQCTICRQGFIQKSHLMNHSKKHKMGSQII